VFFGSFLNVMHVYVHMCVCVCVCKRQKTISMATLSDNNKILLKYYYNKISDNNKIF
jgi:hypothetical protein